MNMTTATLSERLDQQAAKLQQSDWFPACGGTETPFTTRTGRRLLYVWQPATGKHAYLDLGSDHLLSDDEARLALGTY